MPFGGDGQQCAEATNAGPVKHRNVMARFKQLVTFRLKIPEAMKNVSIWVVDRNADNDWVGQYAGQGERYGFLVVVDNILRNNDRLALRDKLLLL